MRKIVVEEMEELANRILLKAIDVAFICQEYFKVIKWTYTSLSSYKNDKLDKLYIQRALSFA